MTSLSTFSSLSLEDSHSSFSLIHLALIHKHTYSHLSSGFPDINTPSFLPSKASFSELNHQQQTNPHGASSAARPLFLFGIARERTGSRDWRIVGELALVLIL
jgi:hypothetical protein